MPAVYNRNRPHPPGAVDIGRGSKWGNPYRIGQDGTRSDVLTKYAQWALSQPEFIASIKAELCGKDLLCYCKPLPCHGDFLLEVANRRT
jgi:hypothetical protein